MTVERVSDAWRIDIDRNSQFSHDAVTFCTDSYVILVIRRFFLKVLRGTNLINARYHAGIYTPHITVRSLFFETTEMLTLYLDRTIFKNVLA